MSFETRYFEHGFPNFKFGRDVAIAIFALVLLIWLNPVHRVQTGSRGVITVGGAIRGIEGEGFVLLAPWQKLDAFSIRAEQADIKDAPGGTSDLQQVSTSLVVRYSVLPDKVAEVFEKYSHTGDLSSYVQSAAAEVFKQVTSRYTAPDLIAKRSIVSGEILQGLQQKLFKYGAQVINIDMTNFEFSKTYMAAINEKATEEQKKQAADNKLKTVESEQKQKVAIADADAAAVKARADGEAYALSKVAEAQANALRVQNAALRENKDVLQLRAIEVEMEKAKKWDGALPVNMYANTPIPFMSPTQYVHPAPVAK